jgi:hypothetical protein
MTEIKNESKEIDLLELFSLIGKGIKNGFLSILKALLFLVVFGVKQIHWLAIFTVVGGAIGYFLFSSTQRYYSSDLIAQSNGITAIDMVQYINDLNGFTKKQNTPALSNALNLSDSVSKKIKNIEAYYYIDVNKDKIGDYVDFDKTFDPKDTNLVIDEHRFFLKVEVFDNTIFASVKTGIYSYVAKNPYLMQLNDIRKKELQELVSTTEYEITKLDSLQNIDYFKNNNQLRTSNDSRLMFLSEKDKQLYYKDKMKLILKKQEYLKELEMATDPITIIKDFTQLSREENPRSGYIIKFGFWFCFLGYIFLLLFRYSKKLFGWIEQ